MPTSSCSYLTSRMERMGYLTKDPVSRRYKIGLAAVALAHGSMREMGFRSITEPILYRLASDTGLSAGIGVMERGQVVLVDRVESPLFAKDVASTVRSKQPTSHFFGPGFRTRAQRDVGRHLPVHATALGKVLLAHLSEDELIAFLRDHTMTRLTAKTIVSRVVLEAQLKKVMVQSYAMVKEEMYQGVWALGVPIIEAKGTVRMAIALNGPLTEPAWKDLPALVRKIEESARDIARQIRLI